MDVTIINKTRDEDSASDQTIQWVEHYEKLMGALRHKAEICTNMVAASEEYWYKGLDEHERVVFCKKGEEMQERVGKALANLFTRVGLQGSYRIPVPAISAKHKNDLHSICKDAMKMHEDLEPALQVYNGIHSERYDRDICNLPNSLSTAQSEEEEAISSIVHSVESIEKWAECMSV